MWTIDVLKSRAFRLALAFALAIAAAAAVVFTLIYLQFSAASERMVGARLTDEATRALVESDDELLSFRFLIRQEDWVEKLILRGFSISLNNPAI